MLCVRLSGASLAMLWPAYRSNYPKGIPDHAPKLFAHHLEVLRAD